MDTDGSLLERLRQQLADLESNQRRSGGTATAGFWSTPSPDAAEPTPTKSATSGAPDRSRPQFGGDGPQREYPARLTMHWANWSHVGGAYASGFAFAAASLDRPQMQPGRMSEPDLVESVTELGAVQHYREVNLVRIVTELEARGVPYPDGLSRVDWLRVVDPTLTASAAKAVVTCAAAFKQPRWAQLRHAVTGEPTEATTDNGDSADSTGSEPGLGDGYGSGHGSGDGGPDDGATASGAGRVTVGKAPPPPPPPPPPTPTPDHPTSRGKDRLTKLLTPSQSHP